MDEIGTREKTHQEINKFRKLSYGVLGRETDFDNRPMEVDIRNYAKHVLLNGARDEKRELLGCIRSRLEIKDKVVFLKLEGK